MQTLECALSAVVSSAYTHKVNEISQRSYNEEKLCFGDLLFRQPVNEKKCRSNQIAPRRIYFPYFGYWIANYIRARATELRCSPLPRCHLRKRERFGRIIRTEILKTTVTRCNGFPPSSVQCDHYSGTGFSGYFFFDLRSSRKKCHHYMTTLYQRMSPTMCHLSGQLRSSQ